MSGTRETILATIRRSLGADSDDDARRRAAEQRLAAPPRGVIPARGQIPAPEQVALFREMAESVQASVEEAASPDEVPAAVAQYLRRHNLPQVVRRGEDPRLSAMPWDGQKTLEVNSGPSAGDDPVGLAHALAGVAETGTLLVPSGPGNPSTLNFLPESHIVALAREDIVGDYESAWARLREAYGRGAMPRTLNMITGPSRSADIEQTILLGAHGPKRLHIVIVG